MAIGAGKFRHRVTVQRRDAPSALYRSTGTNWSAVVENRAAKITPLRGSETVIAERLQGVHGVEITLRDENALDDISTDWRLINARDTSVIYDIKHVARNDLPERYITLTCEAGAGDDGG